MAIRIPTGAGHHDHHRLLFVLPAAKSSVAVAASPSQPARHFVHARTRTLENFALPESSYAREPPYTMMPIPVIATAAPAMSQRVSGMFSTFHNQSSATVTYTPP